MSSGICWHGHMTLSNQWETFVLDVHIIMACRACPLLVNRSKDVAPGDLSGWCSSFSHMLQLLSRPIGVDYIETVITETPILRCPCNLFPRRHLLSIITGDNE